MEQQVYRSFESERGYESVETFQRPVELDVEPTDSEFALLPIELGFDWEAIMRQAEERNKIVPGQSVYLVVFRSQRLVEADVDKLIRFDAAAHEEASLADGYITYFKGDADDSGNNLSFCLWQDAECAQSASQSAMHTRAAGITSEAYSNYSLERYWMQYRPDEGSIRFIDASR